MNVLRRKPRRSARVALMLLGMLVSSRPVYAADHRAQSSPPAIVASSRGDGLPVLRKIADIPLAGSASRFDYQSYDPDAHLLFIAHLGASAILAFDTRSGKVVAELRGVSRVHGVLVVPQLRRVYASATGTNEIVVVDEDSLRELARTGAGVYPDGIAYAPAAHRLFVSDEFGATETVIDVRTNKRVATIPLGGEAGNSRYDAASGHIFVNVQTRNELVEIDPATDAIVGRIALEGADRNHGLLIDPVRHLAFVACEGNARLLVLDLERKKTIARASVGARPDVMAFDPGLRLLYVASESGTVSVFRIAGKTVEKVGEQFVAQRAHSIAVDPATHLVYLPLQNVHGRPVLRIMAPARRPGAGQGAQFSLMKLEISFGREKTMCARSPRMPAPSKTGCPGAGPSAEASVLNLRLKSQNGTVAPSAVVTK